MSLVPDVFRRVCSLGVAGYLPQYDQIYQVWYPGTPEHMTKTYRYGTQEPTRVQYNQNYQVCQPGTAE